MLEFIPSKGNVKVFFVACASASVCLCAYLRCLLTECDNCVRAIRTRVLHLLCVLCVCVNYD